MVSLTSLIVATLVVAIIYYYLNNFKSKGPGKQLPGPAGIPILGSLFSLSLRPHRRLGEWVQHYGPIFQVKIASYNFVIISDNKLAREAYNEPALLGRPPFELFNVLSDGGKYGLTTTQGSTWQEQRRFTLRHLRDFGFGKSTHANFIMDEVNETLEWLKSEEGKSITLNRKFTLAIVNSLWQIMTGKRFKQTDPELHAFLTALNNAFLEVAVSPLVLFFPALAKAIPGLSGWGRLKQLGSEFNEFARKPVKEHMANFDPNEPSKDFIDSYIKEIKKTTDPKSSLYQSLGEKNMETVVGDLFGAGSETTSTTMSWAILYLTKHPDTLKKMQKEIDAVVGPSRTVCLEDREKLAYCECVILEVLRKSTIVPFGLFHYALQTTVVSGYTIPKGSWVAVNQHFIHHDPEIWGDPEKFRPERWLNKEGKAVPKNDNLVAFSVGKRVCIGEQIAQNSVFLFLTNIVKRFNIEFDKNLPEPSMEPKPGFISLANLYNVVMTERAA